MISIRTFSIVAVLIFAGKAHAENPKDFTVEAPIDGQTLTLSKQRGKVVALHFLLKTECPYCLRYTHAYLPAAEKTAEVVHVFLKPDSPDEIKSWAAKIDKAGLNKLPRIYRDADAALAKKFGIPEGYKFHGQSVHYPAMIVLDEEGREIFRYIGKDNRDRLPPEELFKKLAERPKKSTVRATPR